MYNCVTSDINDTDIKHSLQLDSRLQQYNPIDITTFVQKNNNKALFETKHAFKKKYKQRHD